MKLVCLVLSARSFYKINCILILPFAVFIFYLQLQLDDSLGDTNFSKPPPPPVTPNPRRTIHKPAAAHHPVVSGFSPTPKTKKNQCQLVAVSRLSDDKSISSNNKSRRPPLSIGKKNHTAEEHRNEMLAVRSDEQQFIRDQKKKARLAARRSVPTEIVARQQEDNNSSMARDTLMDGLNDPGAIWNQDASDDNTNSIEFDTISRPGSDDDDEESVNFGD